MRRIEPRLLTQSDAAEYCRMGVATFKAVCGIAPVRQSGRKILYDRLDLDRWIDNQKTEQAVTPMNEWDSVLTK
jgi:hypothetical protein